MQFFCKVLQNNIPIWLSKVLKGNFNYESIIARNASI